MNLSAILEALDALEAAEGLQPGSAHAIGMGQAKCWDARHHLLAELRKAGIEIPVVPV